MRWIERIALEWKHAGRLPRVSMAAVVIVALLEFRERVETVAEAVMRAGDS